MLRTLVVTLSFSVLLANPVAGQLLEPEPKKVLSASALSVGNLDFNKSFFESLNSTAKLAETAKKIGLDGQWIVRSVKKDGEFSKAKIGQQINDVISIAPDVRKDGLAVG